MYKVAVKVMPSTIEGNGLFAVEHIKKGTIVWIYDQGHELSMTKDEFTKKSSEEKERIRKVGYLSPWSGLWIIPPRNDLAKYTNHSRRNNTTVVFDEKISSEPYFVANRDIEVGEEITNDYREFDLMARESSADWV